MIRSECINTTEEMTLSGQGRLVDPYTDPEVIRLTALNLEMAMRNLLSAGCAPDSLVLTADLAMCRLVATPSTDGGVQVRVLAE